jgi:ATP-dependent Clp protease ATP-binding subunit ClpC
MSMWEPFTDNVRRSVYIAQEEAQRMGHGYIGTEHFLLGILGERGNRAAKALESLGVDLATTRQAVESIVGLDVCARYEKQFTTRLKHVFEVAVEKARTCKAALIAPEHFVLAILEVEGSTASRVLSNLGVTRERLLEAMRRNLT